MVLWHRLPTGNSSLKNLPDILLPTKPPLRTGIEALFSSASAYNTNPAYQMQATNSPQIAQDGARADRGQAKVVQWSEQEYGGLEVNRDEDAGIEVHHPSDLEAHFCRMPQYIERDSRAPPHVLSSSNNSPPRKRISGFQRKWFYTLVALLVLAIIGAGVGAGVGLRRVRGVRGQSNTTKPSPILQNSSIAAIQWRDNDSKEYRVYIQSREGPLLEAAWSSSDPKWKLSRITKQSADIMLGTPITATVGYPYANSTNNLAKIVYFLSQNGTVIEHESPWKQRQFEWSESNFGTVSNGSSLFSFWDQNLDTQSQIRVIMFQDLGENSVCIKSSESTWAPKEQFPRVQGGSALAAAPVGSRRDLRLYMVDNGIMRVYRYNLTSDSLYDSISTTFNLLPHTALSISTQDNRDYFTNTTLPDCARGDQPFTHLIMFPTPDQSSLNLISWNCSSGFVNQTTKIEPLLKAPRTYLGLANTVSSLDPEDQRVYVLFDGGDGPEIEEWQVPPGSRDADWRALEVPTTFT
ncbi:hypothetical protein O1611_g360 [Lasiodiplodia mahajangana]|uniref:Uncharacterized protein n=1 Tax=Lasiodiplodia mahajangana TaxID=1108764 RepID=A0ACC2K0M1_9PEZI|nr:hypothetical protein O1611_g360 [Lasiodiplodia mahajangana]